MVSLRQTLRAHRRSTNPVVRYGIGTLSAAHRVVLFVVSGEHRWLALTKVLSSRTLHQTTTLTWMNRYPGVFAACREHLGDSRDLRVLSFGCSTGDEVLTLRDYFPLAAIVGADINRRNLAACRRRTTDDGMIFVHSSRGEIRRHGPYDAAFCMAVLQRTPVAMAEEGIVDLGPTYPFEKFDRQVREVDGYLKVGGLLAIHHSQYRFADASVAHRYAPLDAEGQEVDTVIKFGRDSRRLEHSHPERSIFLKLAD